jgi:hypothetical protein
MPTTLPMRCPVARQRSGSILLPILGVLAAVTIAVFLSGVMNDRPESEANPWMVPSMAFSP